MNSINRLAEYIFKQAPKLDYVEAPSVPIDMSPSPMKIPPVESEVSDGGENIPSQNRLYLDDQGHIPKTDWTPDGLGIASYKGLSDKDARFVDRTVLQMSHKATYEQSHGAEHDQLGHGGIIMSGDGKVMLLRKPNGTGYGNKWTLAKGGAEEGEDSPTAALREVQEEMGIKGRIIGEVPGHYSANGQSNKYHIMEVDEDTGNFDPKETAEVKWMTPEEAEHLLNQDYEGKDNATSERDIQAIRAASREYAKNNKSKARLNHMKGSKASQTKAFKAVHDDVVGGFGETGSLPEDLATNSFYKPFLLEIANEINNPYPNQHANSEILVEFMENLFRAYDKANGYIVPGTEDKSTKNLDTDFEEDKKNQSIFWGIQRGFGKGWGTSGRPTFRSEKDRNEIIEVYEAWKNGDGPAKGTFSNGQKYNFENRRTSHIWARESSMPGGGGDAVKKTEVDSWELVYKRSKALTENEHHQFRQKQWNQEYLNQGRALAEIKGVTGKSDEELMADGENLMRQYVKMTQQMTHDVLKAIYPDETYFWLLRKTDGLREVVGDSGVSGDDREMTAKDAEFKGGASEQEGEPAQNRIVHSGSLAGYSVNPDVWHGAYAILRKTHFRDIFMLPSLGRTGGSFASEREAIVVNNPDSETVILNTKGKHFRGQHWTDSMQGITIDNIMGAKGSRKRGVSYPDQDFGELVEQVTKSTTGLPTEIKAALQTSKNGQLGTNKGGVYKMVGTKGKKAEYVYLKKGTTADGRERLVQENLANNLYRAVGIAAPETALVNWEGGVALTSKWLPDAKYHAPVNGEGSPELQNNPDIKHGVLMDCVLANWDVAGAGVEKPYGNLIESDGVIHRVDQGGALEFGGLGDKKSFEVPDGHLSEIDAFINNATNSQGQPINPTGSHVFKGMTETDWNEAGKKLVELSNGRIEDIVNESGILPQNKDFMIKTLKGRRDNALTWWIENTDSGYNSIDEIYDKTAILRMDLFKAVDKELEEEKNAPVYYDFQDKAYDRGEATQEDDDYYAEMWQKVHNDFDEEVNKLTK